MRKMISFIIGLVVLVWMSVNPAYAISISLSDGVTTVLCADGAVCDLTGDAGAVTFSGSVGDFFINVTSGITYPALGSASSPQIDLSSVDISKDPASTHTGDILTILVSEVGYTGGTSFQTSVGGVTTGSVSFNAFLDDGNTLFAMTDSIGTLGAFGPGAFAGTTSGVNSASAPYSLTLEAVITHPHSSDQTSFNYALSTSVPEPSTLLLLGSGLVGLGLWGRKRFKM